jgi:hypothetical protein
MVLNFFCGLFVVCCRVITNCPKLLRTIYETNFTPTFPNLKTLCVDIFFSPPAAALFKEWVVYIVCRILRNNGLNGHPRFLNADKFPAVVTLFVRTPQTPLRCRRLLHSASDGFIVQ